MRAGLIIACGLAASGPAWAGGNDFRLNGTRNGEGILFSCAQQPCVADDREFRNFATELAFVLSPRLTSPADTLGMAGFNVGIGWTGNFVSGEDYWLLTEDGQQTQEATTFLNTLQVDIRKGLPWSFELAATFTWLTDSQIFAPGAELRWAFQEGYSFLPDFGLRGAVSTMVGNPDMDLTTLSADVVISKPIPAGAIARITPYVSFAALFVTASTGVVDPTPVTFVQDGADDPLRPDVENDIAFQSIQLGDEIQGKLTIGIRSRFSLIDFLVQGELQALRNDDFVGPAGALTVRLALNY